jgi:flavin reductase (DIM6/NTAB) family NADH-FMN oxidoreductase RutF
MDITPNEENWRAIYKIMIGSVIPRPIGWVSTINDQGRANLAPFSFFNAVCSNPPHLMFVTSVRGTDGGLKDTLRNVRANEEFVVNIVTESLAEAMNITATEFPAEVDEFEAAGLEKQPSVVVRPPRVAASPLHYECKLAHIYTVGEQVGAGSVVIGRVVHIHVHESVLMENGRIDRERLAPIGRLAGMEYCRVRDVFELIRPPSLVKG